MITLAHFWCVISKLLMENAECNRKSNLSWTSGSLATQLLTSSRTEVKAKLVRIQRSTWKWANAVIIKHGKWTSRILWLEKCIDKLTYTLQLTHTVVVDEIGRQLTEYGDDDVAGDYFTSLLFYQSVCVCLWRRQLKRQSRRLLFLFGAVVVSHLHIVFINICAWMSEHSQRHADKSYECTCCADLSVCTLLVAHACVMHASSSISLVSVFTSVRVYTYDCVIASTDMCILKHRQCKKPWPEFTSFMHTRRSTRTCNIIEFDHQHIARWDPLLVLELCANNVRPSIPMDIRRRWETSTTNIMILLLLRIWMSNLVLFLLFLICR